MTSVVRDSRGEEFHQLAKHRGRKQAEKAVAKAHRRDHLQALHKMCSVVDGQMRITDDPPLVMHVSEPEIGDRFLPVYHEYLSSIGPNRRQLVELPRLGQESV